MPGYIYKYTRKTKEGFIEGSYDGKDWVKIPIDVTDPVNHPLHYCGHPSGIECIQITEHMNFNLGNVIKYIWREGLKPRVASIEDLKKARWYLDREIARAEKIHNQILQDMTDENKWGAFQDKCAEQREEENGKEETEKE